jgi:hypothetical protein
LFWEIEMAGQGELSNPLRDFVGALRPGPGTTQPDLHNALDALNAALAGGQAAGSALPSLYRAVSSTVRADLVSAAVAAARLPIEALAREAVALEEPPSPRGSTKTLVALRTMPSFGPLMPEWARGLSATKSHGPFVSDAGELYWIDVFDPVSFVSLVWSSPGLPPRVMALMPGRTSALDNRSIRLSAGSVWLAASVLVPGRPANEFVGVRIRGGALALSGPAHVQGRSIVVTGNWHAELKLTLNPPAPPAAAADVGGDAVAAKADLPARATLTLHAGSAAVTLADSKFTAYGTSATLTGSQAAPFYDEGTRCVVVPCDASIDTFAFAEQQSTLFTCGAEAPLLRAGWSLVTTVTTPDKLGQASGAGSLWLALGKGLSAGWTGLGASHSLAVATIQLAPGIIAFTATIADMPLQQMFSLWNDSTPPRRTSAVFEAPAGAIIYYLSQRASEAVLTFGRATAHLDRPAAADGRRLGVALPNAVLVLLQNPTETHLYLTAADPAAGQKPKLALALTNLLATVHPPVLLLVNGPLQDQYVDAGKLTLRFDAQALLPTLPDPYAASFEAFTAPRQSSLGWVVASVTWSEPSRAALDFALQTGAAPTAPAAMMAVVNRETPNLFMLDLSGNADQFGVALPAQIFSQVATDGLSLTAPAARIGVFTLPPISWEPMLTKQPNPKDDPPVLPPPHDGGPALITAESVKLVPVAPTPLLTAYIDAVKDGRNFRARLPLPFGIIANINSAVGKPLLESGGLFDLNQPTFGDLTGARQLRLRAPDSQIVGMSRHFPPPSSTETVDDAAYHYASGMLSNDIHQRWRGDFGPKGAPVTQYELTGYGASLFSDWSDQSSLGPAIIQARFDVLVGRTGYQVIQMQATKYPWCAKCVRIITIQRTNGGWILREDSGWVPVTDGLFRFPSSADLPTTPQKIGVSPDITPAFDDARIDRGAVKGVVNIRNIRLAGPQFSPPGSAAVFRPVKFDADVLLDQVAVLSGGTQVPAGANPSGTRVPSRGIDGYIHIDGPHYTGFQVVDGAVTTTALDFVAPATEQDIFKLLTATGPATAPVSCIVAVGGTSDKPAMTLRVSQAAVSCDDHPGDPHLVAALRHTPVLPRDGAWSVGRMKVTDTAPNALEPQVAVPLVRPSTGNGADRWHLADPADIRRLGDGDKPKTIYGLLQSAGTQKTFFARPQALDGAAQINVPQPPSFADVGALFNAAGIFPNLGDAFAIDGLSGLDVTGTDIGFKKTFAVKKVGGNPRETMLMNLGVVTIVLRYANEKTQETAVDVKVDPAASPRWAISLRRVCFAVKRKNDDLIRIYADVKADEKTSATFENLNVHYVGMLHILQDIFANIQQVARFLPGGAGAGLKVGFSHGRLTVRNDFALPNLPLGTGEITDIAVAMGLALELSPLGVEFVAGLGSTDKPFRWVVSPLAGTGVIQVGVNTQGLNILIQGGLGLGLAIDLGIAAGSAAITLAVEFNTLVDPFALKYILSGRASVDVMRGLASVTLTLSAGLGVIPPANLLDLPVPPDFPKELGPYTIGFLASVAVGIHISVCWVADIDWDDSWQFRQDITTPKVVLPF